MPLLDLVLQLDTTAIDSTLAVAGNPSEVASNVIEFIKPSVDSMYLGKAGIGAVGGFILSIYNLVYQSDQLPTAVKPKFFLLHFLLWPAIGFLIPWIYLMDGNIMSWFLCFQTGLTGPAIIQGLFSKSNDTVITDEDA